VIQRKRIRGGPEQDLSVRRDKIDILWGKKKKLKKGGGGGNRKKKLGEGQKRKGNFPGRSPGYLSPRGKCPEGGNTKVGKKEKSLLI